MAGAGGMGAGGRNKGAQKPGSRREVCGDVRGVIGGILTRSQSKVKK